MRIPVKCIFAKQATGIVVVAWVVIVGIEWWIVPSPPPDIVIYVTINRVANLSTIAAVAALTTEIPIIVWAVTITTVKPGT